MSARVQIPMKPPAIPTRHPTPAPVGLLQRKCSCSESGASAGDHGDCKKKKLQRRAVGNAPETAPPIVHEVLHSSGQPLDRQTRAFFEPQFGHDFSKVRVHTDAEAAESAHTVNALGYTVGPQIVFGTGQYRPGEPSGKRLLAHELTHIVQQRGEAPATGPLRVGPLDDSHEREATSIQRAVEAGNMLPPISGAAGLLRRQAADPSASQTDPPFSTDGTQSQELPGVVDENGTDDGGGASGTVPATEQQPAYDQDGAGCGDGSATPIKPRKISAGLVLNVQTRSGHVGHGPSNADALSGGIDFSVNVNQGKPPGFNANEFGRTFQWYSHDAVNWKEPPGSSTVFFSVPVNLRIDWAIQSRGCTDVSSAEDAAVTSVTYRNIITDLTPSPPSWSSQRDHFWSERLTILHELFHASDMTSKGRELAANAEKWMKAQTITGPVTTEKVQAVVESAFNQIRDGAKTYMSGWPPEERAYADGKPKYESLINDIKARAAREGWP